MRRITLVVLIGSLLVALVAGVAVAKTFRCGDNESTTENPCYGTNERDRITERDGSQSDLIFGKDGRDTIRAQVRGNDNDRLNGDQKNDRIFADDNDPRDTVDCGSGNNDLAVVDPGDSVNVNCEDVRGDVLADANTATLGEPDPEGFATVTSVE